MKGQARGSQVSLVTDLTSFVPFPTKGMLPPPPQKTLSKRYTFLSNLPFEDRSLTSLVFLPSNTISAVLFYIWKYMPSTSSYLTATITDIWNSWCPTVCNYLWSCDRSFAHMLLQRNATALTSSFTFSALHWIAVKTESHSLINWLIGLLTDYTN
jgi:hypothetical protein